MLYSLSQRLMRLLARVLLSDLDVRGRRNIPEAGPFLLVANHQSILDPLLIQAVCPRVLHTMTKSTQFTAPAMGWYLKRIHAFPVRRYRIDPQAVRIVLRRLGAGEGVSVYFEGERSWDGRLQPPRLGTLRLILKAGVPVVPCAITGAHDAWPRWASRSRRAPVRITFGQPIEFPALNQRREREARLDDTADKLVASIRSLMAREGEAPTPAGGAR